jgi:hypothetical protein
VKIVIISDIHANLAALESLPERDFDQLWCTMGSSCFIAGTWPSARTALDMLSFGAVSRPIPSIRTGMTIC